MSAAMLPPTLTEETIRRHADGREDWWIEEALELLANWTSDSELHALRWAEGESERVSCCGNPLPLILAVCSELDAPVVSLQPGFDGNMWRYACGCFFEFCEECKGGRSVASHVNDCGAGVPEWLPCPACNATGVKPGGASSFAAGRARP